MLTRKDVTLPRLGFVVTVFALGLGVAGCGASTKDAPMPSDGKIQPGVNTRIIQAPDGFRNIMVTCSGTTGIYVTSKGRDDASGVPSALAVLANDPTCGGSK
jgi:hypothetical protein